MANIQAPFGARPVFQGDGSPWTGRTQMYYVPLADGTEIHPGDFVKSAANGDANGIPAVTKAAAGNTMRGVMVAILPAAPNLPSLDGSTTNLAETYVPATKTHDYYILVADTPDLTYVMQGDAAAGNQVATSCNKNADITVTVPNPERPYSATVISGASIAVTQALPLRLMGLAQVPNNSYGAFASWYVRINQHELQGNTAGV